MKTPASCLLFVLLPLVFVRAQAPAGASDGLIDYEEELISLKYYVADGPIDRSMVAELMKNHVPSKRLQATADSQYDSATFLMAIGTVSVISAITISFDDNTNWYLVGAGAAAFTVSGFKYKSSKQNAKKAVRLYNNWVKQPSGRNVSVSLALTSGGARLSLSF